jgi:hypothetical protein
MVQLYDVLNSVGNRQNAREQLSQQGYKKDKSLSNHNNQVYYNKEKNDLIYNVRGSHNLRDFGTNLALVTGNLKSTKRYMDAHKGIRQAKAKYKIDGVKVTGESLGGAIASGISSQNDKVRTFNKASSINQKVRPNENSFRVAGDVVSLFNSNNKNTKTLKNNNIILPSALANAYIAHSSQALKNQDISI